MRRITYRGNQDIKTIDDSMDLIAPQYERAWQMLLPYLVLEQPVKPEKLDLGMT